MASSHTVNTFIDVGIEPYGNVANQFMVCVKALHEDANIKESSIKG